MSTLDVSASNATFLYGKLGEDLNITIPAIDISDIDLNFPLPNPDDNPLYDKIDKVTIEEVTTGAVNGTGAFDKIMQAINAHLLREYQAGRITGSDYSTVYLGSIQSAMAQATEFVLGRNNAYWQALLIAEQAKQAQYATLVVKAQLATAQMGVKIAVVNGAKVQLDAYTSKGQFAAVKMSLGTAYTQGNLIEEQTDSYKRDVEQKVMKSLLDTWMTRKTIDDGVEVPVQLDTASIDSVVTQVKANANL